MKRPLSYSIGIVALLTILAIWNLSPRGNYDIEFLEKPCIKSLEGKNYLTCDRIEVMINDDYVVVPNNFKTDLATIPKWYWRFLSPLKIDIVAPSILHDYLYSCPSYYTRDEIDNIFYNSLKENGVSMLGSYSMFIVARLLGASHFQEIDCEEPIILIKYLGTFEDDSQF